MCAGCSAPIVGEHEDSGASAIYTTHRLPADTKNAEAFNRACRSGRVDGAAKRGRVWSCTREAWDARRPALAPRIVGAKTRAKPLSRAKGTCELPRVSEDVLRAMGARTAS